MAVRELEEERFPRPRQVGAREEVPATARSQTAVFNRPGHLERTIRQSDLVAPSLDQLGRRAGRRSSSLEEDQPPLRRSDAALTASPAATRAVRHSFRGRSTTPILRAPAPVAPCAAR